MRRTLKLALAAGVIAAAIAPTVTAHFNDPIGCTSGEDNIKKYNGEGEAGSNTIYNDHRSPVLLADDAIPQELENPLVGPDTGTNGGSWIYLEFNNHAQLQTGGLHPVLGDVDPGSTDDCFTTHNSGPGAQPDLLLF